MMTLKEMCVLAGVKTPKGAERILCHPDGNPEFSPFEHQISGLSILAGHEWSERSALWDEPGVGKTIPMQALILLYHLSGVKSMMVMPPKLMGRWMADFKRDWTVPEDLGFTYFLIQDMTPKKRNDTYAEFTLNDNWPSLMLMSYERIRREGLYLKMQEYTAFLFDEADKLSNPNTKLWGSIWRLFYSSKGKYGVHLFTGSEIRNIPTDAYGLIKLIDPELFYDYSEFYNKFVDEAIIAKYKDESGKFVRRTIGYTYRNLDELGRLMNRKARKETLRNVQKFLPELRTIEIPVDLSTSHLKLYRNLVKARLLEVDGELLDAEHASQLRHYAGRILSCPQNFVDEDKKVNFERNNNVLITADEVVESINPYKHKVIIWAWYRDTINHLRERYSKFNPAVIYGGQSTADSEANRIMFEESSVEDCGMMIANWGAGGAGFNWQCARYMLFVENPTTPRDIQQSIARMERTGQKHPMICYFLRVMGTIADKSFSKMVDKTMKVTEINGRVFPVQDMEVELFGL
ncbi:Helicase conserved C-terminal domain-containing protein [Oceanospirillum multiglobuliferum]|uniref:Helicase ATP-binding domain-containing protein n=1 Tax=Oceanospirillum multiglobuliferum TaxID=64969 RepID=A0A1T4SER1_9GAMM|nr:SNF2-related protein [Oceanospirillum multiglobuliferum]OPX54280.1 hypothetical protein BTE48_14900 [Oceanospirillum multiglobuliferum]SKA26673.1 Helicase conserved C-terminal domain-containing protein [Oceanospirillum multiglobuliferum]